MTASNREIAPGAPARGGTIPLAAPAIGEHERELVAESLASGWVAYGPFVDRLEARICELLGVEHAVGVASGTAALHLALEAAGVRAGDEVPVSTLTFISPAFAIRYLGAWPVFVDAEPLYRQLSPERLEAFLRDGCAVRGGRLHNRRTGRRIAAIVAVDVLGHPADFDALTQLAGRYGVPLIEDAAEALGASQGGRPCGSRGMVGCLSFNGNKIVTAGSGGVVVTDDAALADRVRYLATQAKDDPLEYVHGAVGFNYRLSNVHAALGYGQLLRLDEFVAAKRRIAAAYTSEFTAIDGIVTPREAPGCFGTDWLYTVHVDAERYGMDSRALLDRLLHAGVQARPLWQPLHRSPALADAHRVACPVADDLHATGLSLPSSTSLTLEDQARVVELVATGARRP